MKQSYPSHRFLIGRNPVLELLRHLPERIEKVFLAERETSVKGKRDEILTLLGEHHVQPQYLGKDQISKLVGSDAHQGVIALLRERKSKELKTFIEEVSNKEQSLVLILDAIEDPQNFGSILRAAECFGVDAVIHSKNRGTSITPTVRKVSMGASELLDIITVSNIVDAARRLKQAGFWIVVAEANPALQHLKSFSVPPKCALVLGSEGKGIQNLMSKSSDFQVFIPLVGRIESLNVGQACSVLLYHMQALREPH